MGGISWCLPCTNLAWYVHGELGHASRRLDGACTVQWGRVLGWCSGKVCRALASFRGYAREHTDCSRLALLCDSVHYARLAIQEAYSIHSRRMIAFDRSKYVPTSPTDFSKEPWLSSCCMGSAVCELNLAAPATWGTPAGVHRQQLSSSTHFTSFRLGSGYHLSVSGP